MSGSSISYEPSNKIPKITYEEDEKQFWLNKILEIVKIKFLSI